MTTPTTPPPVVHTASPTCACADCERVAQPAPTAEGGKLAAAYRHADEQYEDCHDARMTADEAEWDRQRSLLRAAQSEVAAAWAAAHQHERAASEAGRERDEARAEVERLTATAQRSFDRAKRDGLDIDDGHGGCVDWGWTGKVEVAGTMYGVNELVEQVAALRAELARPPTAPAVHLPAQMQNLDLRARKLVRQAEHMLDEARDLAKAVPIQHDDQQGGKPVTQHCEMRSSGDHSCGGMLWRCFKCGAGGPGPDLRAKLEALKKMCVDNGGDVIERRAVEAQTDAILALLPAHDDRETEAGR